MLLLVRMVSAWILYMWGECDGCCVVMSSGIAAELALALECEFSPIPRSSELVPLGADGCGCHDDGALEKVD